ncbi:MAG: hypothetical protein ABR557_12955, partial [Pyrinomonadaceae bacterium]
MDPHEAFVNGQLNSIDGGLILFRHDTLPPYPNSGQRQQLMASRKNPESSFADMSANKSGGLQSLPP